MAVLNQQAIVVVVVAVLVVVVVAVLVVVVGRWLAVGIAVQRLVVVVVGDGSVASVDSTLLLR